jgi:hypothetical protein
MARLPQPGGDDGTWGNVLNDFLTQAHNADGSLKPINPSKVTGLSAVATSGSYTDLANKPTIPSTATDLGAVSASGLDAATATLITSSSSTTAAALRASYGTHAQGNLRGSQRIKNMATLPPAAPPTMASPPTVAWSTTNTAGLTKSIGYAHTELFRWDGPLQDVATAGAAIPRGYTKADGSGFVGNANSSQLAFDFDGASVDIWTRSNNTLRYRVWVNEQAITTGMQTPIGTNGAAGFMNINFGSASLGNPRRIVIDFEDTTSIGIPFFGLRIAPTDSATFPSIPSPRVIIVGDSFGTSVGASFKRFGYAKHLGRLMGWADCWDDIGSIGGTGLVKDASAIAGH